MNAVELKAINDMLGQCATIIYNAAESVDFTQKNADNMHNKICDIVDDMIAGVKAKVPELEWKEETFQFVGKGRECTCGSGLAWQDCGLTNYCG